MAKVVVNQITSGYASNSALNANFAALAAAIENTVSRDGSTPNTMSADLDLNNKNIINLKQINNFDVTDLATTVALLNSSTATAVSSASTSVAASVASEASAVRSASSASASALSAASAAVYSTLGLGGVVYDLGSVADPIITFPTDWGTII